MAHQVIEEPIEVEVKKKKLPQTISKVINKTKVAMPMFLDWLILLTITFWYFFFTGLAILFNRRLPAEWLKIAKDLNKGRVARKIQGVEPEKEPLKRSFKIVDLETKRPIRLKKSLDA